MIEIPKKISSIIVREDSPGYEYGKRTDFYIINKGKKDETAVGYEAPKKHLHNDSNVIAEERTRFLSGIKLVRFDDGKFGYVRRKGNEVLFQRFDIATSFNKYGFAMVAKDNFVTWMNKDFELLDACGTFRHVLTPEEYSKKCSEVMDVEMFYSNPLCYQGYYHDNGAWREVYDFSKGEIPLSRVKGTRLKKREQTSYLGTNGELQVFYEYDGKKLSKDSEKYFAHGTDFDSDGHAYFHNGMLFAEGFFIKYENLKGWLIERGFAEELREEVADKKKKTRKQSLILSSTDES